MQLGKPTLMHLEQWLHQRIIAYEKPICHIDKNINKTTWKTLNKNHFKTTGTTLPLKLAFWICKEMHCFYKCPDYSKLTPKVRICEKLRIVF